MTSGIYAIKNNITDESYVGATSHMPSRWSGHFCVLRKGNHHSKSLQESFNRYGEAAFVVDVLEECRADALPEREEFWIEKLHPAFNSGKPGGGLVPGDNPHRHVVNISDEMQAAVVKFCEDNFVKRQTEGVRMLLGKALKAEGLL